MAVAGVPCHLPALAPVGCSDIASLLTGDTSPETILEEVSDKPKLRPSTKSRDSSKLPHGEKGRLRETDQDEGDEETG